MAVSFAGADRPANGISTGPTDPGQATPSPQATPTLGWGVAPLPPRVESAGLVLVQPGITGFTGFTGFTGLIPQDKRAVNCTLSPPLTRLTKGE